MTRYATVTRAGIRASNLPSVTHSSHHNRMSLRIPQGSDVDSAASVYSETNTVTVTSLMPGSIYAFQIRARNERGYGPYSSTIYFTTLPLGTVLLYCYSSNIYYAKVTAADLRWWNFLHFLFKSKSH